MSLVARSETVLLQTPPINGLDVETPVGPNFERRQLTPLELTVYRRRMNLQIIRQLLYRHYPAALSFHSQTSSNNDPILPESGAMPVPLKRLAKSD